MPFLSHIPHCMIIMWFLIQVTNWTVSSLGHISCFTHCCYLQTLSQCLVCNRYTISWENKGLLIYLLCLSPCSAFPVGSAGKESACNAGNLGSIPGQGDPLEKGMATHSSVLFWRIPWTEEPGGLQSMVSQRGGHEWSDLAGTHRHGNYDQRG